MKKKKESNPLKAIRKMHVECMGGLGLLGSANEYGYGPVVCWMR